MKRFDIWGGLVILLLLSSCSTTQHIAKVSPTGYELTKDAGIKPDSAIQQLIIPYRKELVAEMSNIIGYAAQDLDRGTPESTLGNWVGDLLHQKAEQYYGKKVDFAISNAGGLRLSSIPQGPITTGMIYELMPFDNMLVIMHLKGELVSTLFDHMAAKGGWPVSHQVRYQIKERKAVNITINGSILDPKAIYTIALPDYVANGGDDSGFLKGQEHKNLNLLVRDAMIEFVEEKWKAGEKMKAELQNRVDNQ